MGKSDMITLAELRKIAKEALGDGAVIWEGVDTLASSTSQRLCESLCHGVGVKCRARSASDARRRMRDLLTTIIAGREMESLRASYRVDSERALKNERELRESKERFG